MCFLLKGQLWVSIYAAMSIGLQERPLRKKERGRENTLQRSPSDKEKLLRKGVLDTGMRERERRGRLLATEYPKKIV